MIGDFSSSPVRSRPRGGRAHLGTALAILLMAGMVYLGISHIDLSAASNALGQASLPWVAIAALSVAAAFFARAESWFAALATALPEREVRRPVVIRGLMIGVAASTVAPARAGEAIRTCVVARRIGGRCVVTTVLGTVVAQTLLNLLALSLLALVVISSSSTRGLHLTTVAIAVAVPVLVILAVTVVSRCLGWLLPGRELRARPTLLSRARGWVGRQLSGTGRGLKLFSRPRTAIHAGGTQLGAWALQWFACFAVMQALGLGHHASAATAAAVLLAINLSAAVPVTPGNVGIFQAACMAVLTPLGVSAGDALAYGLLLQGVEIAVALTLALPAVLGEGMSLRDLGRGTSDRGALAVTPS